MPSNRGGETRAYSIIDFRVFEDYITGMNSFISVAPLEEIKCDIKSQELGSDWVLVQGQLVRKEGVPEWLRS